jgi:hypothetical protein
MKLSSQEFYKQYYNYAKIVESNTGIPYEVILAVWSWESDYKNNRISQDGIFNLGGTKYVSNSIAETKSGMYADYKDLTQMAQDFSRILNLSYYKEIKNNKGGGYKEYFEDWNKSPYAESDYNVTEMIKRATEFKKLSGSITNTINQTEIEKDIYSNVNSYIESGVNPILMIGILSLIILSISKI